MELSRRAHSESAGRGTHGGTLYRAGPERFRYLGRLIKSVLFGLLRVAAQAVFRFRSLGRGTVIKPFPRKIIGASHVTIGEDCFFAEGLMLAVTKTRPDVAPQCVIGDRCNFGYDAFISCTHSITIGNDVLTSARIFIGDSYHGYSDVSLAIKEQPMEGEAPVAVGDGSFLGIGCAILPGVTLGRNCVVAANAVVTKSFPDYSVIAGVPAKLVKRYDPVQNRWIAGDSEK